MDMPALWAAKAAAVLTEWPLNGAVNACLGWHGFHPLREGRGGDLFVWLLAKDKQRLTFSLGLFGPCQIYFQVVNRTNFLLCEVRIRNLWVALIFVFC